MRWNVKTKKPKLGDRKEVIRFAFFPVRIGKKRVWFEEYIKIYKFKKVLSFVNNYPAEKKEWVCIKKKTIEKHLSQYY